MALVISTTRVKVKCVLCEHANIKSNTLENYFTASSVVVVTTIVDEKEKYCMIKYNAKTLCATIHNFVIVSNGKKFIHMCTSKVSFIYCK